jgi:hypothetical protein
MLPKSVFSAMGDMMITPQKRITGALLLTPDDNHPDIV